MDDIKDFSELYSTYSSRINELIKSIENIDTVLDLIVCVLSGSNNNPDYPVTRGKMRGVVITNKRSNISLNGFSTIDIASSSRGTCMVSYDTRSMDDTIRDLWLYIFGTVFSATESLSKRYLGLSDVTGKDILRVRAGMYIITYCLLECCLYPPDTERLVIGLHPYSYAYVVSDILTGIAKDEGVHCGIPQVYCNDSAINKMYSHDLRYEDKVGYELKRDSFYLYK